VIARQKPSWRQRQRSTSFCTQECRGPFAGPLLGWTGWHLDESPNRSQENRHDCLVLPRCMDSDLRRTSSLAGDWRGDWNISGASCGLFCTSSQRRMEASPQPWIVSIKERVRSVTIIVLKDAHLTFHDCLVAYPLRRHCERGGNQDTRHTHADHPLVTFKRRSLFALAVIKPLSNAQVSHAGPPDGGVRAGEGPHVHPVLSSRSPPGEAIYGWVDNDETLRCEPSRQVFRKPTASGSTRRFCRGRQATWFLQSARILRVSRSSRFETDIQSWGSSISHACSRRGGANRRRFLRGWP